MKKKLKSQVLSTIINDKNDGRPYAEIFINNVPFLALLDSGANLSLLGSGSERFVDDKKFSFRSLPSVIKTASGQCKRILGYIYVKIQFQNKTRKMRLYIAPDLQQPVYLGIDFWNNFGIVPTVINECHVPKLSVEVDHNEHSLSLEEKKELEEIINLFPSFASKGLGQTNLETHHIDVGGAKPVKQRHYAVSPAVQKDLNAEIDRMLNLGVIEESGSAWSSPVSLVRKANGKIRLCLDARKINEVTVKDAYPLPLIDGLLSRLDQTKYISSIDLKDAFWQIPLDEGSRQLTAFTVPGRPLYHFKVMPFGLCNAPQRLCRLMHKVIPNQLHDRIFVYLDDLLITSATLEEHLYLLRLVAKLTINVEKSKFVLKQLKYLGYIVGEGCLKVDPGKIEALISYPVPKTVRQVRRFLGMTGWYRRFIQNYSTIAAPITDLLGKKSKMIWSPDAQQAFEKLKTALTSAPVLQNPNFNKPFYIQCDASKTGVGSVLFQRDDSGEKHPIAYVSQKLNAAQRNYSITELECYAAVLSVKKFRAYVEGFQFTIITDHASLKWLMDQKDLSGRLARWSLKLQGFTFKIEYRKGSQNIVPDALSRVDNVDELLSVFDLHPLNVDLNSIAFSDPEYLARIANLKNVSEKVVSNLRTQNGHLFISPSFGKPIPDSDLPIWKLFIPNPLIPMLIKQAHDPPTSAHMGAAKTLELLRRKFFWPKMARDVKNFVKSCEMCKQCKPVNYNTRPPMGSFLEISQPWQRLYVDFLGPYPRSKRQNKFLLIVMDQFSRFVLLKPLRQATSQHLVDFLEHHVFDIFSVPEYIFSDNGKQFESKLFASLLNKYGISHMTTPKYSPQANASERANRTILSSIRAYIKTDHKDWDLHIHEISSALRNFNHDSTGFSPHYLVFGEHKRMHGSDYKLLKMLHCVGEADIALQNKSNQLRLVEEQVLEHLKAAHEKNAHQYNLRSRVRKFNVGQKVFVKNFTQSDAINHYSAKLAKQSIIAFIKKPIGKVAYECVDEKGKNIGVYHIKDIRNC